MSRLRNLAAVALLTSALVVVLAPGIVQAKKQKFHGAVTMNFEKNASGPDRFSGVVSSPNPRCVRGAVVTLTFRPAYASADATQVASGRTDAQGNWEILYDVLPNPAYDFATFAAHSPTRTLKSKHAGVQAVCKFQASDTQTIYPGPPGP